MLKEMVLNSEGGDASAIELVQLYRYSCGYNLQTLSDQLHASHKFFLKSHNKGRSRVLQKATPEIEASEIKKNLTHPRLTLQGQNQRRSSSYYDHFVAAKTPKSEQGASFFRNAMPTTQE